MDSGASDHMTNQRTWFDSYTKFKTKTRVKIGNGDLIMALGKGSINILAFDGNKWNEKTLLNVLYVPDININLFSSGRAVDKGLQMISDQNSCKFIKDGRIVAVGERKRRLYEMKFKMCRKADDFEANVVKLETTQT